MRAMILGAGLGTRLRPLTDWLPKPALPVRGAPVIAYLLALLERHGVNEVIVNTHHRADEMERAARETCPASIELRFSRESELLGTGGGIRAAASFLRQSNPSLVIAGDMILEVDLATLARRHQQRGSDATLVLRDDPRAPAFGTIGVDDRQRLIRVSEVSLNPPRPSVSEAAAGVFVGLRIFSPRVFDTLPDREVFEDLRDWLAPRHQAGDVDVACERLDHSACGWQPIGTPAEYLEANLDPIPLASVDRAAIERAAGVAFDGGNVIGKGAEVDATARLRRTVVWEGERVPAHSSLADGVFAHGMFHPCEPRRDPA